MVFTITFKCYFYEGNDILIAPDLHHITLKVNLCDPRIIYENHKIFRLQKLDLYMGITVFVVVLSGISSMVWYSCCNVQYLEY